MADDEAPALWSTIPAIDDLPAPESKRARRPVAHAVPCACADCRCSASATIPNTDPLGRCYSCAIGVHRVLRPSAPGGCPTVDLTPSITRDGLECARQRLKDARGTTDKWGKGKDRLASHEVGATGERVLCEWIGAPFLCGSRAYKTRPDQWGREVKTTEGAPYLKVYPKELEAFLRPDVEWWLVILPPTWRSGTGSALIAGWTTLRMVREWVERTDAEPRTWGPDDRRPPAYFVPIAALQKPVDRLSPPEVR